ncbi:TonB-dependent receptor [bacterium]|nr:TonB-dependent receptor [bacterium]
MLVATIRAFRILLTFSLILVLCMAAESVYAGVTGKFVGNVTDVETDEPLEYAQIAESNGDWGGATDLDGDFLILNIPPGVYNVEVTYLGYHPITLIGIQINSGLTTKQDIQLTPTALKRPEVEIKVEPPLVKLDNTGKDIRIDKDKIKSIRPEDIGSLVGGVGGFKMDEEGRFHVRGSRDGEVAFLVDGVDIRDPLVATRTQISLGAENVQEVNILTGGFTAEYGRATGAIVQITTAEGASKGYSGRLEYQTDRIIDTYSFDTDRAEISIGGPIPYTADFLRKPVTFYFTGICKLTNTYTPFDIRRPANDYMGIGLNLPERQQNNFSGSLKLAYKLTDRKKLSLYLTESFGKWDIYPSGEGGISGNYGYNYLHNLDSRPWAQNKQFSGILTFTDQLSEKTFYELKYIYFRTHSWVHPGGKNPGEFTLREDAENTRAGGVDGDGNGFIDGFVDANNNGRFDGGGEGYEDWNFNGRWDRGEDWVDLNGNGVYDAAEPWIDVVNPLTGENNLDVYDSWDTYRDLNGNGRWDPAEPQLPEHDWNRNGYRDGERFIDANGNGIYDPWEPWEDLNGNYLWDEGEPFIDTNGNGRFDYSEGYDDKNTNGRMDYKDLINSDDDTGEPFIDGDFAYLYIELPFIDQPDLITGLYNGVLDPGEMVYRFLHPLTELFSRPATLLELQRDPSRPIWYAFDPDLYGADWPEDPLVYIPEKSTWINRTLHDIENPVFDYPNGVADIDKEWWLDYNNNGRWDSSPDNFLNPNEWDPTAYWYDRVSTENTLKFDIQSQVSKHHEVKSGVEIKFRDLQMQSIQQPDKQYTGEAVLPENSPWPDRGGIRDFYRYRPIEGALYAQDKMEFEGLIINAGLRYDFIRHDQDAVDEFRDRLIRDEPGAIFANRGTWRLSPRLGISHPITERAKLYFNYGHFYQAPQFQYFYRSATANFDANSTIGNPNLEYEKTVQYELGVNTQISELVVIDISGYYKDQFDLISTSDERWKNLTLDRYVNLDYGRMRGFEFSIEKRPYHHYALTFNYDFSYAYGKASDQHANREARLDNQPYNWDEHPLAWDETHKINAYITILYSQGEHPRWFGMVLPDDWMMTVQWQFGSGLPYTPSKYLTGETNQNLVLPNSYRRPWHENTTLKFEKYYTLNNNRDSRLFFGFTVYNLFNRRNIVAVYTR